MDQPTPREHASRRLPTRRTILIGAGATAGLAIGYLVWPRSVPLNLPVREGEMLVNGWLKLGADGNIIVAVPQAEMGQGVYTALPQLLAGEMGADWQKVSVEPAPLHPIYANRAFAPDMSGQLPSLLAGIANWAAVTVIERYAVQATGGSTSVRAFWEPLRLAGASAREMLLRAGGRALDADWGELDTRDGFVEGGGKRVAFADLIVDLDPADAPAEPRMRETPPLIGTSAPRIDIPAKTDGSAMFGADVRLPGMVYAAIRAKPLGAGERVSFGGQAAASADGVLNVVEDEGWHAVVADTWWRARRALDLVDVEYEEGSRANSEFIDLALENALAADTGTAFARRGDVGAELAKGAIVEREYAVPFLAHACLEPMTATVRIENGRAEVWVPTQSATLVNWRVADALGISESAVTIYPTLLGGGFGRKVEVDCAVQAAKIAAASGRPVQLIWHREEDMAQDKYRPAARARLRGALDAGKRIAAWDFKLAAPNLGESFMSRVMPRLARGGDSEAMLKGADALPYDIPAFRAVHADVPMPVPLGYWRSVEHSYTAFFVESFVDELAAAAGLDPLTFRLRMMDGESRAANVLRRAATLGGLAASAGAGQGRGIALHSSFGSHVAQVAEVEAATANSITVRKVTCVIDCGQVVNPDIVRQQMEGGIIFGLTAALHGQISFVGGESEQMNFDSYPLLRMDEAPEIEIDIVRSHEPPGGVGEPGVPPIAPAVSNAVFAATGRRLTALPFLGY